MRLATLNNMACFFANASYNFKKTNNKHTSYELASDIIKRTQDIIKENRWDAASPVCFTLLHPLSLLCYLVTLNAWLVGYDVLYCHIHSSRLMYPMLTHGTEMAVFASLAVSEKAALAARENSSWKMQIEDRSRRALALWFSLQRS